MGFEVFDKRNAPLAKAPSVTIQKKGIFSINRAAHNLIGAPETVELLFDRDEQIIAMKPSDEPHAYAIRAQTASDTGQMILSASAFTQFFDIDTTVSRRYKPYEQDGMLCINLQGPRVEIVGNRSRQGDSADDGN
ncbi:hypothetical protein IF188_19835 [Microbacterium sp. NEAU-LLC]|uniref:Uncharacterized protein n=1 Tax=Microbacterium helvum TaxID=2773713 RepID=A0ABR8NTK1_9MICO|nr:hypothetical protein [Microbacterium helvum]MBD3943947.1 hypothetical protein [Microbacterium helvum]